MARKTKRNRNRRKRGGTDICNNDKPKICPEDCNKTPRTYTHQAFDTVGTLAADATTYGTRAFGMHKPVNATVKAIPGAISYMGKAVSDGWDATKDAAKKTSQSMGNAASDAGQWMGTAASDAGQWMRTAASDGWDATKDAASRYGNMVTKNTSFGKGGRKTRKGGRKTRKGGRKTRRGGRKSRKGGRKSRKGGRKSRRRR